jgi:hypothetical protein
MRCIYYAVSFILPFHFQFLLHPYKFLPFLISFHFFLFLLRTILTLIIACYLERRHLLKRRLIWLLTMNHTICHVLGRKLERKTGNFWFWTYLTVADIVLVVWFLDHTNSWSNERRAQNPHFSFIFLFLAFSKWRSFAFILIIRHCSSSLHTNIYLSLLILLRFSSHRWVIIFPYLLIRQQVLVISFTIRSYTYL